MGIRKLFIYIVGLVDQSGGDDLSLRRGRLIRFGAVVLLRLLSGQGRCTLLQISCKRLGMSDDGINSQGKCENNGDSSDKGFHLTSLGGCGCV